MDIDELQNKWTQMNSRLSNIESDLQQQKMDKMKTAQERLAMQYRMFAIAGGIFIFASLTGWRHMFGVLQSVLFAAFFAVCMTFDIIIMLRVRAIDIARMPVSEVAERARRCRRLHHISQLVLIPCAMVVLGVLCYSNRHEEYLLWGCLAGMVVGACLGLMAYRRIMANYRKLT